MARYFKNIFSAKQSVALRILLTSSILLLTSSCQEGGEAGDLFGQWRMEGSDSKYISFSGSIIWIKELNVGNVYGNFQHQGDSLFIQCVSTTGDPIDTVIVEDDYGFTPFTNIRTKIVTLDSDRLILSKGNQKWIFEKY